MNSESVAELAQAYHTACRLIRLLLIDAPDFMLKKEAYKHALSQANFWRIMHELGYDFDDGVSNIAFNERIKSTLNPIDAYETWKQIPGI
jgi:hypothetical protein